MRRRPLLAGPFLLPAIISGLLVAATAAAQEPASPPAGGETAAPDGKYEALLKKVGELEKKVADLEGKAQEDEAARLKKAAEAAAEAGGEEGGAPDEAPKSFFSGTRALQAQNPEISLVGDFLGTIHANKKLMRHHHEKGEEEGEEEHEHGAEDLTGFSPRALELVIQANIDPYSFGKAVLCFHGGHLHLGEAYLTWTGILPRTSLTIGKMRQQFGILNRWHEHALDQVDPPRSLQVFLGEEGLNQTGATLHFLLPRLWAHANEVTISVTNTENATLFAGEFWTVPSVLAHVKSYYDLNKATYLELGLSGLWGFNNRRGVHQVDEETGEETTVDEPWRSTVLAGADLSVSWTPPQMAKYRRVTWRTEFMFLFKQTAEGDIRSFGGFSYLDVLLSQQFGIGARIDAGQEPGTGDQTLYVQGSPYVSFWQSEWLLLRLQYNYLWRSDGHDPEHVVLLQADWTLGPHRHDKY